MIASQQYDNNSDKAKQRREEDFRVAKQQTELAERELKKWKAEESTQIDITNKLENIRAALGLNNAKLLPQFQQNQADSLIATPEQKSMNYDCNYRCEFDNTFGKNDSLAITQNQFKTVPIEEELSLRNVETELSKLQNRLLQEISNKKINIDLIKDKINYASNDNANLGVNYQIDQQQLCNKENNYKGKLDFRQQQQQNIVDNEEIKQLNKQQNDILLLTSIKKNDCWQQKSGNSQQQDSSYKKVKQMKRFSSINNNIDENQNYSYNKQLAEKNQMISTNSLTQLFQKGQDENQLSSMVLDSQLKNQKSKIQNYQEEDDNNYSNNQLQEKLTVYQLDQIQQNENKFLNNSYNKSLIDKQDFSNTNQSKMLKMQNNQTGDKFQQDYEQDIHNTLNNKENNINYSNLHSNNKKIDNDEQQTCNLMIEDNPEQQQQNYQQCQELKQQIEQLEKAISNLSFELQSRCISERYLKHQLTNLQNQQFFKDEESKNQILLFENQIRQLQNSRELLQTGGNNELKNYIFQLETDLYMTKSQLNNLAKEKSITDAKLEDLEKNYQTMTQKVEKELDKKYQAELRELKYIIQSLTNENDTILQYNQQNNQNPPPTNEKSHKRNSKSSCQKQEQCYKLNQQIRTTPSLTISSAVSVNALLEKQRTRKERNKTITSSIQSNGYNGTCCTGLSQNSSATGISKQQYKTLQEQSVQSHQTEDQISLQEQYLRKISQLSQEKYQLEEKIEWLELQQRSGYLESKGIQDKGQEFLIFDKRYKSLKESTRFWKEKAQKLSQHYYKILQDYREEMQSFKSQYMVNQKQFFLQCEKLIKEMVTLSQQENKDLRNDLVNQQEKINLDQQKIALLRNKIKKLQQLTQTGDEKENKQKNQVNSTKKEEKDYSQSPHKQIDNQLPKKKHSKKNKANIN